MDSVAKEEAPLSIIMLQLQSTQQDRTVLSSLPNGVTVKCVSVTNTLTQFAQILFEIACMLHIFSVYKHRYEWGEAEVD